MISLFPLISRMNTSPYFTSSGRQTRSAAREAISALSTRQKQPRSHIKIECEKRHQEDSASDDNKIENAAAKKPKKEVSAKQGQTEGWQPANWREHLANIREMRKSRDAPVDSQGCEKTADINQSPEVGSGGAGGGGSGKGRKRRVVGLNSFKIIVRLRFY